jgi:hypothetical protein
MESMSSTHDLIQSVSRWASLTEIQILYVGILFVVVCVLSILWFSRKKSKALNTQLEQLQKALIASNSTTIGMGQKLIHLEKQLQGVDQYQQRNQETVQQSSKQRQKISNTENNPIHEPSSNKQSRLQKTEATNKLSLVDNDFLEKNILDREEMPSDEAYETSRQLLSQGVDISEIVKQSGLSYSEVFLMQKLAK